LLEEPGLTKLVGRSLGRWLLEIAILAVVEFVLLMVMVNSFQVTSDTGFYMIEGTLILFGGYSIYLIGLELSRREGNTLLIILYFTGLFFSGLGTYLYTSYVIGIFFFRFYIYKLIGLVMIGVGIILVISVLVGALVKRKMKK
jgi:hypothetical protein